MNVTSEPILAVSDIAAAISFYRDKLGFTGEWFWRDRGPDSAPTFGGARLGEAKVMFCLQPELAARIEGHQLFFHVEDVQSIFEQHSAAGVHILHPLEDKPWGVREYTARDLNGYHLRFAGAISYVRPPGAADQLPPRIRIESRIATLDEYVDLFDSVGWSIERESMAEALTHTRLGVVAKDTRTGQTVGMVRICGDGRYFTIWDVIVRPSHQGQKIGTAMMTLALADIKILAPQAKLIGLFTGKGAFYERLGFHGGDGMCRAID